MSGADPAALNAELHRLLDFGRRFSHPLGGTVWLGVDGAPDPSRPILTYMTARMTHVYAISHLLGWAGGRDLATQGLAGLTGRLRDAEYGGWFTRLDPAGRPDQDKGAYTHAFVVLAASSAVVAGLDGSRQLLDEALEVWLSRFFADDEGMFVDAWNRDFTRLDPYRGVTPTCTASRRCWRRLT